MLDQVSAQKYEKTARALVERFEAEENTLISEDVDKFYSWLAEKVPSWRPSTIRFYRNALKYYLSEVLGLPPNLEKVLTPQKANRHKRSNSSALKSRYVHEKTLEALGQIAFEHNSENLNWAYALIRASIAFGLRPIEWQDAVLDTSDPGMPTFVIKNAKASDVRACGEYRTIYVVKPNLVSKELEIAQWIIEEIKKNKWSRDDWVRKTNLIQSTLRATRLKYKELNKKPYLTLYSARHQFASNAKKAGLALEEIAALMGHAVKYTCASTYGRRVSGWSSMSASKQTNKNYSFHVKPDPEKVAYVIQRSMHTAEWRMEQKRMANKPSWMLD